MNFRILAASVRPRRRVFALLAATALVASLVAPEVQAQQAAPAPAPAAAPKAKKPAPKPAPAAPAAQRRRHRRSSSRRRAGRLPRRSAPRTAGSADLRAVDQILPEGSGRQRQAGLLHRQGWPHQVRPARHRSRHHRARRRDQENPARDPSARHAARSRHPRHRRQQSAGTEPLCDLLPEWLHVGLRGDPELLANMKKGQNLVVQAINSNGAPLILPLPLADFAKAYDGPPTDLKKIEDDNREIAGRAAEARQRCASEAASPSSLRPMP